MTTDTTERSGPPEAVRRSRGAIPAFTMLAGTLISLSGLAWDIGWHSDVGPDSFFTLPHLFVYSGGATAGVVSLVMVLRATAAQRKGLEPDPTVGGRAFRVLGVFRAPIGYLVGGLAAASFLLYGLWDEWWHGLYGFDVTIASPPHQGWLHSISLTIIGTAIVFAAAVENRWGRYGFVIALATFGSYLTITSFGLADINLNSSIAWPTIAAVVIPIVCVLLAARVVPRGGAAGTGAAYLLLNLAIWTFANWGVTWYADVQHLALRDFVVLSFPTHRLMIPAAVLIFGVVVEAVTRWREVTALMLGVYGAVGAVSITWWVTRVANGAHRYRGSNFGEQPLDIVATCVASGLIGAVVGIATWRLGHALRVAGTEPAGQPERVAVR